MIFFWLVGGARHDVRATGPTGPNRNLFGTYGVGEGGGAKTNLGAQNS